MSIMIRTMAATAVLALCACGDDDGGGGSEAIRRGVGAECNADIPCEEEGQDCLTRFDGGYCGIDGCAADVDCPAGSACVTEDDGVNYCFLVCLDKPECNVHRDPANESNCNSSLTFVDPVGADGRKVCRPPMSGV